jgi:hypothetical protein
MLASSDVGIAAAFSLGAFYVFLENAPGLRLAPYIHAARRLFSARWKHAVPFWGDFDTALTP